MRKHAGKGTIFGRAIAGRKMGVGSCRTQTLFRQGTVTVVRKRSDVNMLRRAIVHLRPESTEGERGKWLALAREKGCYLRVRRGPNGEMPAAAERGDAQVTEVERNTYGKHADVFQVDASAATIAALLADRVVSHWHDAIYLALPRTGSGQAPAQATERPAYRQMTRERGRKGAEMGEVSRREEAQSEVYGPVRPLDQSARLDIRVRQQAAIEEAIAPLAADPRSARKLTRLEEREAKEQEERVKRGERGPIRETRPSSRARLQGKLDEMKERAEEASKARAIRMAALERECPTPD